MGAVIDSMAQVKTNLFILPYIKYTIRGEEKISIPTPALSGSGMRV
jgi:hypothetical protein